MGAPRQGANARIAVPSLISNVGRYHVRRWSFFGQAGSGPEDTAQSPPDGHFGAVGRYRHVRRQPRRHPGEDRRLDDRHSRLFALIHNALGGLHGPPSAHPQDFARALGVVLAHRQRRTVRRPLIPLPHRDRRHVQQSILRAAGGKATRHPVDDSPGRLPTARMALRHGYHRRRVQTAGLAARRPRRRSRRDAGCHRGRPPQRRHQPAGRWRTAAGAAEAVADERGGRGYPRGKRGRSGPEAVPAPVVDQCV